MLASFIILASSKLYIKVVEQLAQLIGFVLNHVISFYQVAIDIINHNVCDARYIQQIKQQPTTTDKRLNVTHIITLNNPFWQI